MKLKLRLALIVVSLALIAVAVYMAGMQDKLGIGKLPGPGATATPRPAIPPRPGGTPSSQPDSDQDRSTSSVDVSPVYLDQLSWDWASTGWVALADDHLPKLDSSFLNDIITIGNESYTKGIGTFPLSEIAYKLDGNYRWFQTEIGVDGLVPTGRGSVVFKVFLDDVLAYDSGVISAGMAPTSIQLSVVGISKMKLVVEDAGDGSTLDYANWANARLVPTSRQFPQPPRAVRKVLEADRDERQRRREWEWASVDTRFQQEMASLSRSFRPVGLPVPYSMAIYDESEHQIAATNGKIALTLGYSGERHGFLNIADLESGRMVAFDTAASLTVDGLGTLLLPRDTVAEPSGGYQFKRVQDSALGSGLEISANYLVPGNGVTVSPRITIFDEGSYLTYQLEMRDSAEKSTVRDFTFFDQKAWGNFLVGDEAEYITDYSLIRRAELRDDSILRQELLSLGKPLLIYSKTDFRGLLMSIIDYTADPARFSFQMDFGRVAGRLGFTHHVPDDVRATRIQDSPRLFIQPLKTESIEMATVDYRRVMSALHPAPPIPQWVKYQWGTWYAFYMDYDESIVRAQVDYIANNLADLGPWSILLDAGWYVAEGRPGSTWDNVDYDKFPSGLRATVDYAHSKGIKVVLYFSAPYLDDRDRPGNWLGLSGFIEQHPDWLIPLEVDSTGASYVYDFTNPALVSYMRGLISDFFRLYNVDGIKIDGLGQAEGERLAAEERDVFGDVNKIRMFTMDIYRLIWEEATKAKPDVYVESGWATPNLAAPYAHTFRYADEFPAFQNRYPSPGLAEHVDYAALQETLFGQRANMGMVWGGPESQQMIRNWFQAALAMSTQMTLSTDLTRLSSRDLSALRSVLVNYNAFQGETHFVGMPLPESFATTSNGTTYLGVLNRGSDPKETALALANYGLDPDREYSMLDPNSGSYSRVTGSFTASISGSSLHLFILRDTPGMMSTNSSFNEEGLQNGLRYSLNGPASIMGFAQIHTPEPYSVKLDGRELVPNPGLRAGFGYWYDRETQILRLRYRHDRPHMLEVNWQNGDTQEETAERD